MLHLLDVELKGYYTFYCTIRDIFELVHSLKSHIDFSSCVRVQIYSRIVQ